MQLLSEKITSALRNNSKAIYRLSYEFDKHTNTIKRWLDENDQGMITDLLTPQGLRAISEELEVKRNELLTEAD